MPKSVVLAGCGNMGHALLRGWLKLDPAPEIHVVEPVSALRERASLSGASAVAGVDDLPAALLPDIIVLAVKPQMMPAVLPAYSRWAQRGSVLLSIAAGTTIATIETLAGSAVRPAVVRCMPNTPAAVGRGVLAFHANGQLSQHQLTMTRRLLAAGGEVIDLLDEAMIDMITAVSGSGPAYVFHFIEALTDAALKIGLPREAAGRIARQTVIGAAALAAESDEPASTLRENVTSPGGTTAAALSVLMTDNALPGLVAEAVDAAWRRAVELGKAV